MGIEWQVRAGSSLEEVGIGQNSLRNLSYEHFYLGCRVDKTDHEIAFLKMNAHFHQARRRGHAIKFAVSLH
jgi:hypothetical protein